MRFIEKISTFAFPLNAKHTKAALLAALLLTGVAGCSDDDDDTTPTGYLKFYNASSNSPAIYITLDDNIFTSVDFGASAGLYTLNTGSFDMELSYKDDVTSYVNIFGEDENGDAEENNLSIGNGVVDFYVLTGSIEAPEVTKFEYDDEDPDTDTDQFALRVINTHADDVEVYMSYSDETFAEAVSASPLSTSSIALSYLDMSDSELLDLDSYKFYISTDGGVTAAYESDEIPFIYTTQYVFMVRENTGPGDSLYTLDKLSKTTGAIEYPDLESQAEVRFYNGLTSPENSVFPTPFTSQVDLELQNNGVVTPVASGLEQGTLSATLPLEASHYSLYINATGEADTLTKNNRFVNLEKNSDKTVFLYTDEVKDYESDDDNDDTTFDYVSVVRTLTETNITSTSLYSHTVKVVNLVDDFSLLGIYFIKSNETYSTATNALTSSFGNTKSITLTNNTYRVLVLATENEEVTELDSIDYTFDETTGNKFMVIEEDATTTTGYKVTFITGND